MYTFQPGRDFSFLKFKLRDDSVIKVYHNDNTAEDDLDKLLAFLNKKITEYNDERINILHPITRGKNIYEGASGLVLAIVLAGLLISFLILLPYAKPGKVDWVYIVPAYGSGIYFISQVISHRRKKRLTK